MHFYKQVEPVFDMVKVAFCLPAWKIVIKALGPVLDALHLSFNNTFLKRRMKMVFQFQKLASLWIPRSTVC